MGIEVISENPGFGKIHRSEPGKKREVDGKTEKSPADRASSVDRVEISKDARKMVEQDAFIRQATEEMEMLPDGDLRRDVCERVALRLQSGYYDRAETLREVVQSLMESLI